MKKLTLFKAKKALKKIANNGYESRINGYVQRFGADGTERIVRSVNWLASTGRARKGYIVVNDYERIA
jgi:hypothetical protein